jgi:hypothetical protein
MARTGTGSLFLVVEFDGAGLPFAEFTRDNPGTAVDMLSEPAVKEGRERWHPSLVMVRGAGREALERLLTRVRQAYEEPETLRKETRTGTWVGRLRLRESSMHSAAAKALLQFQHRYGVAWTHLESGVLHMRARVNDQAEGDRLAAQVQGFLAESRVEAQVDIVEVSPHDYSVWEELVQFSLGMST